MTTTQITQLLNIPHSTFNDWHTVGHKKYTLTSLLLGIDIDVAKAIINKTEIEEKLKPIYSTNTRVVKLQKDWFEFDLFWTSTANQKLEIKNIITVYMDRATQINTDKLCHLFGYDRVIKCVNKYIQNDKNRYEALRQLEYYHSKLNDTDFKLTQYELDNYYLKAPKQRVIDYFCKTKGIDSVLAQSQQQNYMIEDKIWHMIEYYKKEISDDTRTKTSA